MLNELEDDKDKINGIEIEIEKLTGRREEEQ